MSNEPRRTLVPESSVQRQVGWWNPDQVYNNLHFLLAQNQASYATHLFITHPRARLGLLESLAQGAAAEQFADGIAVVHKWLKDQSEEGVLPFSFEQLWQALLPILRSSHQRKAIEAQMLRKRAPQGKRTSPAGTGVYPQMGSTSRPDSQMAMDQVRQPQGQPINSPHHTPPHLFPNAGIPTGRGVEEVTKTPSATGVRRVRGGQSKYYTGNYPRTEQIGPGGEGVPPEAYTPEVQTPGAAASPVQTPGAATSPAQSPGAATSPAQSQQQPPPGTIPQDAPTLDHTGSTWFINPDGTPGSAPVDAFDTGQGIFSGQAPGVTSHLSNPTGQYPSLGSSVNEQSFPHQATPTGQFPSLGSSTIGHEPAYGGPSSGQGAPRLISQVPGFQFGHQASDQAPSSRRGTSPPPSRREAASGQYPQMGGRGKASSPSGVMPSARTPLPKRSVKAKAQVDSTRTPLSRATQPAPRPTGRPRPGPRPASQSAPVQRDVVANQSTPGGTRRPSKAPSSRSVGPGTHRPAGRPGQIESVGPARRSPSGTFRSAPGPTTEIPHMGGAAPRSSTRRPEPTRSKPRKPIRRGDPPQSERVEQRSKSDAPSGSNSASQLQAAPRKSQLISRFPLDNHTPLWNENRIYNVLSLRILQDAQSSEMLAFLENPENTKPLLQALHEAAQIQQGSRAIEELYHWFIYTTYERRLDWPAHHFWAILRSLLLESIRTNKRNKSAIDAATTHIALDNLDSASPSMKSPRLNKAPPAPNRYVAPPQDDERLVFDEPVLLNGDGPRERDPQQHIIDILADVETIEIE